MLSRFLWARALPLMIVLLLGCAPRQATALASPAPTAAPAAIETAPSTSSPSTPPSAMAATDAVLATPPAATSGHTAALTVFAAASLTAAFGDVGKDFEAANPGTRVTFSFAGSQQLAQQINLGAPADVFASADSRQMDVAVQGGSVDGATRRVFARNRLVVVYPASNPAKLTTLQDLARPGLKIILADRSVPVGAYALTFLDKADQDPTFGASYKAKVLKNVVSYEQDVKAELSKIELGEADAGIVYTTDITPDAADQVGRLAIPDELNTIAVYPIAVVKTSKHAALAQEFVAYVLSPAGQATLARYGFIPASGRASAGAAPAGPLAIDGRLDQSASPAADDSRNVIPRQPPGARVTGSTTREVQ
ncbi:MAG TPA: molybdate ABC transporter substrate-binding protein [Chloroflexota bacterium]|nr:molybdate ABC transporter substrate-binding protein [Chloroflexota bacterium]